MPRERSTLTGACPTSMVASVASTTWRIGTLATRHCWAGFSTAPRWASSRWSAARRSSISSKPATKGTVGIWFGVITAGFLVGAATGGVLFGWLGDRIGRVRAMTLSILTYALFTGTCGLAATLATRSAAVHRRAGHGGRMVAGRRVGHGDLAQSLARLHGRLDRRRRQCRISARRGGGPGAQCDAGRIWPSGPATLACARI